MKRPIHPATGLRPLRLTRLLCAALAVLPLAAGAQATGPGGTAPVNAIPDLPASVRPDMNRIQGYYRQVEQNLPGARKAERDPFQTTPELRTRRNGSAARWSQGIGAAPAAAATASGDDLPGDWRVQGLLLGTRPWAVLSRSLRPSMRAGGPGAGAQPGGAGRGDELRYVSRGDEIELPDGRTYVVRGIDRHGVLLQGTGVEADLLRLR
ncbi:MAG: hypothetical protein RIQ53_338 [Pseudomonadota bacterium]|jgi:hypothetical protein